MNKIQLTALPYINETDDIEKQKFLVISVSATSTHKDSH